MNNQWFSKIAVWLVIAMVLFTVFKQFDSRGGSGAGYVGYSDFLEEVRGNRIKSATIQEGQGGTEIVAITTDDRRVRTTATYLDRGPERPWQLAERITCPTLVLHATGDAGVPFEEGRLMARLIVMGNEKGGSGKSTTQAAMIGSINANERRHILTLEDPIEYVHGNKQSIVSQREVGFDTETFQDGLKAALREDPDVVLVGEMRDPESIATTLTVAETGHLVFATLHTNDTSTALDRIIDVFPPERQSQIRVQLAASLTAVVAQRLVPRQGGGMIAAFEILLANPAVRALVRDGKTHQIRNVISQSVRDGMQTLEQSLSVLIAHGLISTEDALSRAVVPKEVQGIRPLDRDPSAASLA